MISLETRVQRQRKLKASRPRGHLFIQQRRRLHSEQGSPIWSPKKNTPTTKPGGCPIWTPVCPPESAPIGCHRQHHHAARTRSPSSDQTWSTSLFSPSEGQREVFGLLLDLEGQGHSTCLDRTDEQGARYHDDEGEAQVVGEWWWPL